MVSSGVWELLPLALYTHIIQTMDTILNSVHGVTFKVADIYERYLKVKMITEEVSKVMEYFFAAFLVNGLYLVLLRRTVAQRKDGRPQ